MTREGMRLVPRRNNSLSGFTPYKIYKAIAGTGDANMSEIALKMGHMVHTKNSCNVIDDNGKIRFVTLDFFREFRLESGDLYHD